jgi:hypothetical protein
VINHKLHQLPLFAAKVLELASSGKDLLNLKIGLPIIAARLGR